VIQFFLSGFIVFLLLSKEVREYIFTKPSVPACAPDLAPK